MSDSLSCLSNWILKLEGGSDHLSNIMRKYWVHLSAAQLCTHHTDSFLSMQTNNLSPPVNTKDYGWRRACMAGTLLNSVVSPDDAAVQIQHLNNWRKQWQCTLCQCTTETNSRFKIVISRQTTCTCLGTSVIMLWVSPLTLSWLYSLQWRHDYKHRFWPILLSNSHQSKYWACFSHATCLPNIPTLKLTSLCLSNTFSWYLEVWSEYAKIRDKNK